MVLLLEFTNRAAGSGDDTWVSTPTVKKSLHGHPLGAIRIHWFVRCHYCWRFKTVPQEVTTSSKLPSPVRETSDAWLLKKNAGSLSRSAARRAVGQRDVEVLEAVEKTHLVGRLQQWVVIG